MKELQTLTMSGGARHKRNPDNQGKEINRPTSSKSTIASEANEANEANSQASLDGISKQIQTLQNELKTDLRTFKEDIASHIKDELTELKEDIDKKLAKITTEMGEQNDKIEAALTRTEEVEMWSTEANCALQKLLKEQKRLTDKVEDLELRSRRNNLRIYGIKENTETDSIIHFMDKWLREEFSIQTDLQIQRAHRALAPQPKPGQPPRSIILNFQQFSVKEMILKKAWEKKTIELGGNRIYFDHDYTANMLQQRKAYVNVKKTLKKEGVRFQTPLNKMRIHWASGAKSYNSAEEATSDLRRRGYQVEDAASISGESDHIDKLQQRLQTGTATWTHTRHDGALETSKRVRGRLQEFQHKENTASSVTT